MKPELIVALDVPSSEALNPILDTLPDEILWYKLGLELFCKEGPAALIPLKARGKKIFLDLKLHDIPRTVERAVQAATSHHVDLITVHAMGGRAMLEAAAQAAEDSGTGTQLIAVTTLTSLGPDDFIDLGLTRTVPEQALALGRLALDSGIHGLVTSAREVGALRDQVGPQALLVTPGIRMAGGDNADQKRVATPAMAVQEGASHLVVGRPILEAAHPAQAAISILNEMDRAFTDKTR